MNWRAFGFLLLYALLSLAGCVSPTETRLPTAMPRHPQVEKQSYEFNDPYPSVDLGPDMHASPHGFAQPRPEPRRNQEVRNVVDILRGTPAPTAQPDPLGVSYSGVVRPD